MATDTRPSWMRRAGLYQDFMNNTYVEVATGRVIYDIDAFAREKLSEAIDNLAEAWAKATVDASIRKG
jgi:hypothetical protein